MTSPLTPSWSAAMLRSDLSARAHHLARTRNLLHDLSLGDTPAIIFGRDESGRHGNFHPASWQSICANPQWLRRLTKVHTASRRSRARKDWQWMELDSSNSSDALLMNIFCHPEVFANGTLTPSVATLLNVDSITQPCFGINPGIPRLDGHIDRTEIDLQLSNLFLEAKLTESDFQNARHDLIERYRDLETVFELSRLPRKTLYSPASHPPAEDYSQIEFHDEESAPPAAQAIIPATTSRTLIQSYQLIRNVLAAYAADASFCLLSDARRHDLIAHWYSILSAVHSPTFACRLKLLTWQELAAALPKDLQLFLDAKYGITPA